MSLATTTGAAMAPAGAIAARALVGAAVWGDLPRTSCLDAVGRGSSSRADLDLVVGVGPNLARSGARARHDEHDARPPRQVAA